MDDFLILLQAKLDEVKSKGNVNADIDKLQNQLNKLKVQVELDPKAAQSLADSIGKLINQKIVISNIGIDTNSAVKNAQQTGQQIGNAINQGINNATKTSNNAIKSFADLKSFTELNKSIKNFHIDSSELKNYKTILDEVKNTYAEFGQVKITNESFNNGILEKFKVNIEQVNGDLKETKSFIMSLNESGDAFVFDGLITGAESIVQHLDKSKNAINQTAEAINNLRLKTQADKIQLSIDTGGYESKVESLISRTRQWTDEFGNSRINTDALSTSLKNLGDASTALSNNNTVENQKALINAEKELDTQIKTVTNSIRTMNSETMKSSAVDNLRQKYQEFYDKNGAAHRQWGAQLKQAMLELASGATISKQRGEELRQELIQIQNAARQAGKLGQTAFKEMISSITSKLGSLTYYFSASFMLMKVIQSVKGGLSSVRELDTALVDLKKTTTMTNKELEEFYYASNDVAKQMGVTTKEIISQAAAWSRFNKIDPLYGDI